MTNKPREVFCFYTGEEPFHAFNSLDALSELHNPGNAERYVDAKSYQALLEQAEKMAEALDSIVDWEGYVINNSMSSREVIYEACREASEALKQWKEFKK